MVLGKICDVKIRRIQDFQEQSMLFKMGGSGFEQSRFRRW